MVHASWSGQTLTSFDSVPIERGYGVLGEFAFGGPDKTTTGHRLQDGMSLDSNYP